MQRFAARVLRKMLRNPLMAGLVDLRRSDNATDGRPLRAGRYVPAGTAGSGSLLRARF
jgi:hypothetical protein